MAWYQRLPPGPTDPGVGQMSFPWPGKEKAPPGPTRKQGKKGSGI